MNLFLIIVNYPYIQSLDKHAILQKLGCDVTLILGLAMVFGLVFGGFMLSGGKMDIVLYALPYEGMMIGGGAFGDTLSKNAKRISGPRQR